MLTLSCRRYQFDILSKTFLVECNTTTSALPPEVKASTATNVSAHEFYHAIITVAIKLQPLYSHM